MCDAANAPSRLYLDRVRQSKGPFTDEEAFGSGVEAISNMEKMSVLSADFSPRSRSF